MGVSATAARASARASAGIVPEQVVGARDVRYGYDVAQIKLALVNQQRSGNVVAGDRFDERPVRIQGTRLPLDA